MHQPKYQVGDLLAEERYRIICYERSDNGEEIYTIQSVPLVQQYRLTPE